MRFLFYFTFTFWSSGLLINCKTISSTTSFYHFKLKRKGINTEMIFVSLLRLLAKGFDFFAWPLITLVYPVCASIRAIESNSNTDNKKWLIYWVLYALIILFELATEKIIQWLPFWPYMKLIATCWLVAPHFDGASYVYENIVRTCFSVNPLILHQNFFLSRSDQFLIAAQKYIKENGSQALEKLIINKTKCIEPNLAGTENKAVAAKENKGLVTSEGVGINIKAVEAKENKGVATTEGVGTENKAVAAKKNKGVVALEGVGTDNKAVVATENKGIATSEGVGMENKAVAAKENKGVVPSERVGTEIKAVVDKVNHGVTASDGVKCTEPNLTGTEIKTATAIESTVMAAVDAEHRGNGAIGSTDLKKAPKKWICSLCKVSATCEANLKDHLRGNKHKVNVETLRASKMANKNKEGSASTQKKNDQPKVAPKKGISISEPGGKNFNKQEAKKVEANRNAEQSRQKHQNKEELRKKDSTLWCDKCKIWCPDPTAMIHHLIGKKHMAKLKEQA